MISSFVLSKKFYVELNLKTRCICVAYGPLRVQQGL